MVKKTDSNEIVDIPDKTLEKEIRKSLNLNGLFGRRPISKTDMEKLQVLNLHSSSGTVRELTGIQYASNLINIDMKKAAVTDFSPLADLVRLEELVICDTPAGDLSFLENLIELRYLCLSGVGLKSLDFLGSIGRLRSLDLSNNPVEDFSGLALQGGLTELVLCNTGIRDLSVLTNCPGLKVLYLNDNPITDRSALLQLSSLEQLEIDGENPFETF